MTRILCSGVLAILTAVCIYTADICGKNRDMEGTWFFYAFSLLFAVPLVAIIVNALGQKNAAFKKLDEKLCGSKQEEKVRFVPHWFMILILVTFATVIAINVVRVVIAVLSD